MNAGGGYGPEEYGPWMTLLIGVVISLACIGSIVLGIVWLVMWALG